MTVSELINKNVFKVISYGDKKNENITKPFCCDLLSIAMSRASAGSAFVTVMANTNTLAVASLTECSCIVLAEGICLDAPTIDKAEMQGITVFCSELPIYETAKVIDQLIHDTNFV